MKARLTQQGKDGAKSRTAGLGASPQSASYEWRRDITARIRGRLAWFLGLMCFFALEKLPVFGQSVFFDFNTPGQYTNNFNPWNDNGAGGNGGNYSFVESTNAGVGGSGGVSVFQSNDTTATYKSGSWNFATNTSTVTLSVLIHADGQSSGNKVQLGILSTNGNGFNSNPNVAFESFRFIPSSATAWSLREQFRSANANTETNMGTVSVTIGHWYKFVVNLTNTSAALATYNAACSLLDFGADGLSPGSNIVSFSTTQTHTTGQDIARATNVWAALRAFQNAGIDAWDNFLVYTPGNKPIFTLPLANTTVPIGFPVTFKVLADGPGPITYSWITNGVSAAGATNFIYATPPIDSSFTNLAVTASNSNGSVTNSAILTPVIPALATVTNLPATGIEPFAATLNGQVLATGGLTPVVTLYYGPADAGTNASGWAQRVTLGSQAGSFSQAVSALATNSTYYFTASASNGVGLSWAAPSQSFTTVASVPPLTSYVNPFIGTGPGGNGFGFSGDSGDVFPGADYPRGMVQWSPDTPSNLPGGYNYLDSAIKGFSVRHFSGRGCLVYLDFAFMPWLGPVTTSPGTNFVAYSSGFSHTNETAAPGYYRVLLNSGVQVETTVTKRSGMALFTFPSTNTATLLINAGSSINGATTNTSITVVGNNQAQGYATAPIGCGSELYTVYFAAVFDHPFATFGTWNGGSINAGVASSTGAQSGAFLTFDASTNATVMAKVGLSFVSVANAVANLNAENPNWDFTAIRSAADTAWGSVLNKIAVAGGTTAQMQTFYTALYHCFFHPNVFNDANGQYFGMDRQVHTVVPGHSQYENIPGWDNYRSGAPLGALLSPDEESDIAQSLVNYAQQGGGGLPRWEQANRNSGGMVGDGPVIIIADAYALGATNFDSSAALAAMYLNAGTIGTTSDGQAVRSGLNDYIGLGYVSGTASVTLEYCAADFALSQFARAVGDANSYTYLLRSGNWRTLFNTNTGFIQPRNSDGTWVTNITATSQTGFTEGSTAQYLWLVPFNLRGLFDDLGGNSNAVSRLNAFFTDLNDGPGSQYAFMGNEPDEAVPWEFDYAAAPSGTQNTVRRIQTQLWNNTPNGLPGNDDAGALSSWYVFSVLGFYPLVPGAPGFVLGSPFFPGATINLENGRQVVIQGNNAVPANSYVQSLTINGTNSSSLWLPFDTIRSGATLAFTLGSAPSSWGSAAADAPPSFDNVLPPPALSVSAQSGANALSLSWPAYATNYTLYSTTNLLPPIQWSHITNSPQYVQGIFYLTLPVTNARQQFFRLQGQ